jgi:putative salt-induced outer membrane protein YdiY
MVPSRARALRSLTRNTTLSNKFLMESGSSDTLFSDRIAVTVKVPTKLALSLGYNLQDNNKPPLGLKKLDTVETVNLLYAF